jgi:aminopeptidase N
MKEVLLAAVACMPAVFADNYPRQPAIDVQHYVFRLALSDESDAISGEATIVVRLKESGVTQVALDLAAPADGKGMTVDEVTFRGSAIAYHHDRSRLQLSLPSGLKNGDRVEFTVRYHGIPQAGLRILKNKYGERCFFSSNWPDFAHYWLPLIDHPYDKASAEFLVTAPSQYQVVANGRLAETLDLGDGRRITHWIQPEPIAAWLFNIGVAQFAARHFGLEAGIPLETWVYHQDRDAGIATFEEPTRRAIQFFSSHIGPYPYGKLAAVETPANRGGMEVASAIFYGEETVTGRPADHLVAHETAHQWFGDSVTESDWDDVWLSEGFATYFALLATENYEGFPAFAAGLRRARAQVFAAERQLPGVAVVQTQPWTGIPNPIVYQKGAWVLHLLRGQIGAERFWAGIREYYRRYRDRNASTADFQHVMEEVSGMDLGWFFRQWVYRAGSPVIEGGWSYHAAAKKIEIHLAQIQPGPAYRLPLEIAVDGKINKVELNVKQQRFQLPAASAPSQVELDPNTRMLMDAKFSKD